MTNAIITDKISVRTYGQLPDGREIHEYILRNPVGTEAHILNYGGILTSLKTHDQQGKLGEITLGYDDLSGYLNDKTYMGALIGRYANRIANGRFTLNGQATELSRNDNDLHLHGGVTGFNRIVWDGEIVDRDSYQALKLHHFSPHQQEGYPGNLDVDVFISLNEANELQLEFSARTDQTGIFNPTYHPYFNLNNDHQTNIHNHILQIDSRDYLPVTSSMLPESRPRSVAGSNFDFRQGAVIGDLLCESNEQISITGGYDNCFVLNGTDTPLHRAASLISPESGRRLIVNTDAPGMQFYSGNFLQAGPGIRGQFHHRHHALCLEPQSFPNAPNEEGFPSTLIHPGEIYRRTIIYQFSTVDAEFQTKTLNT